MRQITYPTILLIVLILCTPTVWADAPAEGTINWAKTFENGSPLTTPLTDKIVTSVFPDLGYFYIREANRCSGIRVYDSWTAADILPGDYATVDGELGTDDGERVIIAFTGYARDFSRVRPLAMTNRDVAGGRLNAHTPGAQGASGPNNVGALIRVTGQITYVGTGFFYIDDGSKCADGTLDGSSNPVYGVRVVGEPGCLLRTGHSVAVTGIAAVATYTAGYGRTIRLASPSDVTPICPPAPPTGFIASPAGSTIVILCWNEVPGATGYNIYRGTVSGGQNYSSPVNGGTPVTSRTFPGADRFTFTNTGLTINTDYFYTVTAVTGNCGETSPSAEDSAYPSATAIPWATRNAAQIVAAALTHTPENIGCPADVVGPDGTVYTSEGNVVLPPPAGAYGPLPAEVSNYPMDMGRSAESYNAHGGPYRKVDTWPAYRKIAGYATLPSAFNMNIAPCSYAGTPAPMRYRRAQPWPCPNSDDTPYMYLGSLGANAEQVSAGLRYERTDGKWNLFLQVSPSRTFWVFDPNPPSGHESDEYPTPTTNSSWINFNPGSSISLEYWCGKKQDSQSRKWKSSVWMRASGSQGTRALFAEVSGHLESGADVSMKRVSCIGQFLPFNLPQPSPTFLETGYARSGSYFLDGEWSDVMVYDTTRSWYLDTARALHKWEFPRDESVENIVTFNTATAYSWENYINIDLR